MKRAIDLSLKHTYLAHDVQKVEGTPYRSYLELDEVNFHFAHTTHVTAISPPSLLRFLRAASPH
jgi:hypothetical protein